MPRIAAFPKCFMQELCVTRSMSIFEWIGLASGLSVDGVELHPRFLMSLEEPYLAGVKECLAKHGLEMPMLCYSPDFTIPDQGARREEVAKQRRMIDLAAYFGARTCRVLSGQRRPEVPRDQGLAWVVSCLHALLPYAAERGVILALENHYKDDFWEHPEFAQHMDAFLEILDRVESPWLGVNFDPSNAILAGEDPLLLLEAVKLRVVSMHASDRSLKPGHTLSELRAVEDAIGYASILQHGVTGKGLNDYDAILATLHRAGFDGWISIEDGVKGVEEIAESATYLRGKIDQYWPPPIR